MNAQKNTISLILSILSASSVLLVIINTLGGLVSGIWLLILGYWSTVVVGLTYGIFASYIISFALMPGMLFGMPAVYFFEKGWNWMASFFGFLSILYTNSLLTFTCLFIFHEAVNSSSNSVFPLLLWSYGIAMAPWVTMARSEKNEWSTFTTFVAEIAYIVSIVLFYCGMTFVTISIIFGSIMLVAAICQALLALLTFATKNSDISV